MAMCDGSVRPISYSIKLDVHQHLADRAYREHYPRGILGFPSLEARAAAKQPDLPAMPGHPVLSRGGRPGNACGSFQPGLPRRPPLAACRRVRRRPSSCVISCDWWPCGPLDSPSGEILSPNLPHGHENAFHTATREPVIRATSPRNWKFRGGGDLSFRGGEVESGSYWLTLLLGVRQGLNGYVVTAGRGGCSAGVSRSRKSGRDSRIARRQGRGLDGKGQ